MCHCKNDDCCLKSSECSTGTLIISVMVLNLFSGLLLSRSVNTGSFNVVTVYAVTIGMHVLNVAAGILAIVKLKRRGFIAVMAICVIMIAYHICIVYLVMAIVHNVEFLYFIYFLIRSTPSSKVIDDILIAPSAAFTMFIILQLWYLNTVYWSYKCLKTKINADGSANLDKL